MGLAGGIVALVGWIGWMVVVLELGVGVGVCIDGLWGVGWGLC